MKEMHRAGCGLKSTELPSPLWEHHPPSILMHSPTWKPQNPAAHGVYGASTTQALIKSPAITD